MRVHEVAVWAAFWSVDDDRANISMKHTHWGVVMERTICSSYNHIG